MTYVHAEVKSSERPSQSEGNRQYEMHMRVLRGQKQVAGAKTLKTMGIYGLFSNIIITMIETGKLSTWQIYTVVEIVSECVAHVMLRVLCILRVLYVLCALRLYVLCALCVSCVLCVLCACFVKQEVAGAKTFKTKGKVRAKIH